MTNPYASLLATPGALPFVIAAFVGRLPMSMLGLGCVLLVSASTGSYGLAGAVSAALALTRSVAAPRLGQLTDQLGQRRVLLPSLAVHLGGLVALVVLAEAGAPTWTLFVAAAVTGVAVPQLGSMVRARWTALLGGTPALGTAYAFESVVDEVVFVIGPVLVTTLAVGLAPTAGLVAALVFALVGSLVFAAQRHTEPPLTCGPRARASAVRTVGLRVLVVVFLAVGAVFGAVDVAMVPFARERGSPVAAGPLLAVFALGSLVAGLAYGARTWSTPLHQRFLIALGGLCLGMVPIALADSIPLMALAVAVAGVAISPTLIAGYGLVQTLVPRSALTEGFTWLSTALGIGVAVGMPLAGQVADAAGSQAAFVVALLAGLVAVLVAVLGRRPLRPSVQAPVPLSEPG